MEYYIGTLISFRCSILAGGKINKNINYADVHLLIILSIEACGCESFCCAQNPVCPLETEAVALEIPY